MLSPERIKRFEAKYEPEPNTGCWLWVACLNEHGYGVFQIGHGTRLATRVAWELHHGSSIPTGMCVLHRCDTPACVNPAHLFLGTRLDNARDRDAKGRGRCGEHNKRKTHCRNGHEFSPDNTRMFRTRRVCKTCQREWARCHPKGGADVSLS